MVGVGGGGTLRDAVTVTLTDTDALVLAEPDTDALELADPDGE